MKKIKKHNIKKEKNKEVSHINEYPIKNVGAGQWDMWDGTSPTGEFVLNKGATNKIGKSTLDSKEVFCNNKEENKQNIEVHSCMSKNDVLEKEKKHDNFIYIYVPIIVLIVGLFLGWCFTNQYDNSIKHPNASPVTPSIITNNIPQYKYVTNDVPKYLYVTNTVYCTNLDDDWFYDYLRHKLFPCKFLPNPVLNFKGGHEIPIPVVRTNYIKYVKPITNGESLKFSNKLP
jgi:hypothetical protein